MVRACRCCLWYCHLFLLLTSLLASFNTEMNILSIPAFLYRVMRFPHSHNSKLGLSLSSHGLDPVHGYIHSLVEQSITFCALCSFPCVSFVSNPESRKKSDSSWCTTNGDDNSFLWATTATEKSWAGYFPYFFKTNFNFSSFAKKCHIA